MTMKIKHILIILFASCFLICSEEAFCSPETLPSKTYEQKVETYLRLFPFPIHGKGFSLDQISKVYAKYYSEDEIWQLIQFYLSPLGQKLIGASTEITLDLSDILNFSRDEKTCVLTLEKTTKEVKNKIGQYYEKNKSYPQDLDHAPNGRQRLENLFFSRIQAHIYDLREWSKDNLTYMFQCPHNDGKKVFKKSFVYDPKTGSFDEKR